MSYEFKTTNEFDKKYTKLEKYNPKMKKLMIKTLITLKQNPFQNTLKTHKVISKKYGKRYSSGVTKDLRIIWDFDSKDNIIILLLTIGGHSGKNKVYK